MGDHITLSAGDSITLKVGASILVMKSDGTVTLNGHDYAIEISGKKPVKVQGKISIKGAKVLEN